MMISTRVKQKHLSKEQQEEKKFNNEKKKRSQITEYELSIWISEKRWKINDEFIMRINKLLKKIMFFVTKVDNLKE